MITVCLSMRCSGFCVLVLPGEICHQTMATGRTSIVGFAAGGTRVWEKLLEILIDDPDYEWLMIDASHIKVHPHAAGARGGNQDMGCTKRGNSKIHLAVDAHGMPVRVVVTAGPAADCSPPSFNFDRENRCAYLLADKSYDTDAIIDQAKEQGMEPVIPPRKNRKQLVITTNICINCTIG